MSRIRITHTTRYLYGRPVVFGIHRLVIRPREGHDVAVESLELEIFPRHEVVWHRDLFGNSVAMIRFLESSDRLEVTSNVVIFRRDAAAPPGLTDVSPIPLPVLYSEFEREVCLGYQTSVYPTEVAQIQQWAERAFSPGFQKSGIGLAKEMNSWIHANIAYRRRETHGVQTPMETLGLRSGSCRDMATLLMEGMRGFGFASRFASGYLDNQAAAEGRASTHAWTELYFPEQGWFGFDPTIGEGTSIKHIVTGVSAHPRGVMPVSGTFIGTPSTNLGMTATVRIEKLS